MRPWLDDELVAVTPARGPRVRHPTVVRFAQLLDRPFVGLPADRGLGRFLAQQAARSGQVPHHRVRVSNFDAVAGLVEAGAGVAVIPRSAAERWRDARLQVAPLQDAWAKRRLLICSTAQAEGLPGVMALIEALLPA